MPKTSVKNDRENINSKKAKYMRLFAHLKKPHKVSNKKKILDILHMLIYRK